ncbi:uncharacterized protein LOC143913302 [Arctopsyche grandis]|uniref:uncharacterized protein LOC143913302 n=1 Tax=Arctopsyche grandis TaxID=121162 RepID=UPI00406D8A0E
MLRIPALRFALTQVKHLQPTCRLINARFSSKASTEETNDAPLSYLKSPAATYLARHSRTHGTDDMLWYQPFVVSFSVAAILIYFCILREESDIDEDLGRSLFDRLPGLEQKQLELVREFNLDRGLDVDKIEARLDELAQK